MNLLVLSDLHIGNNDFFETFGWNADEFINAIEIIRQAENIQKIVLNGDVFELYKYSFNDIYKNNPELTEYLLNNRDITYIKGNHDAICPYGVLNTTFENSQGKIIYIEHGHSADFMNGTHLGRKIQTLGFSLLRYGVRYPGVFGVYKRMTELSEAINHIPKKYDSIKYLQHALKLLKQYDMVVLGHTHKIETHKTYYLNNKKQYINCGSCSMGRFQGVIINTETLHNETLKFRNYHDLLSFYHPSKTRLETAAKNLMAVA